jgi:UMF1 family MFS transporter
MGTHHPKRRADTAETEYRRVVNAWAMYDWANSAFAVIILTAVFPVYYRALGVGAGASPEDATAYWAYTSSLSVLVVALIGPLLGAISDLLASRKRFLAIAVGAGVFGSAGLAFLGPEMFLQASFIFFIANFGFTGGNIFYEALLPHIARASDIDRVSARGYAMGYLGGGLLLIVDSVCILRPDWFGMPDRDFAVRASFVSVAIWWTFFAYPLFRHVAEPPKSCDAPAQIVAAGFARLRSTLGEIRRYRQLAMFLLAFWLYNDGINTIIKLAAAYGDEIGVDHNDMLVALILTQFVGFPCSIGFGALAGYIGAKRSILAGLSAYTLICIAGFFMKTPAHFYALAIMVGVVQGGTQALSRSLFVTMVPRMRSAEFFGFFSTGEKFAGVIGPVIFGVIGQLTGSSRWGIVSVTFLFISGAVLLWRVDEEEGRSVAQTAVEAVPLSRPLP